MLVSAVEHLSVGQLGWRQSGRDGPAGDGQRQRRVEVAGHHGGQRAEHGAELVRRSLLLGERLISHMVVLTEAHVGEKLAKHCRVSTFGGQSGSKLTFSC